MEWKRRFVFQDCLDNNPSVHHLYVVIGYHGVNHVWLLWAVWPTFEWRRSAYWSGNYDTRLCFYQTRSAWSMDQGSTKKRSAVHNFVPTVTKFCVMWEGLSLPHDTKFGNCRGEIVDRRMVFIWSLIHGSGWSRLIKADPGVIFINTDYL